MKIIAGLGGGVMRRGSRRDGRCAFLGAATGQELKVTCDGSDARVAEHFCVHDQRRRFRLRSAPRALVDGRCTPRGKSNDWAAGIQPCNSCPLYEPQRLLGLPNA